MPSLTQSPTVHIPGITRKVTFGVANSRDHFIAREDHRVDWILWSEESKGILAKWWANIDTILMGRKTFEVALTQRSGTGGGSPGMRSYVLSQTWTHDQARDRDVEIIFRDAVEFVGELREQPGKDICVMGGGRVGQTAPGGGSHR